MPLAAVVVDADGTKVSAGANRYTVAPAIPTLPALVTFPLIVPVPGSSALTPLTVFELIGMSCRLPAW